MIQDLKKVSRIAKMSKLNRLLNNPFKYIYVIAHRELMYPIFKKEKTVETFLFYGKKMKIALPASADIYITGGKSHSSEIRLAKFMITNLEEGNHFLDIGAHYGYFTLIALELVGNTGTVHSVEPADGSFQVLSDNTVQYKNISVHKKAVSDQSGYIEFYQFPSLHSEYNSSDIRQFEQEAWFRKYKPSVHKIATTTIDDIAKNNKLIPNIIKIDVEGGECKVIMGGINLLKTQHPKIVMEYLEPKRNNQSHQQAVKLLRSIGYNSYTINEEGKLEEISDIDTYLIENKLDSDNIVFLKKNTSSS